MPMRDQCEDLKEKRGEQHLGEQTAVFPDGAEKP
jgi:hypothetical protein